MPFAGELIRASDIGGDVGCRLRRVANQSVNNITVASISWDTEDQDTDGFITVTSATVTIPTGLGGLYGITFRTLAGALLAGRNFAQIVPTSGITGMPAQIRAPYSGGEDSASCTVVIPLLAADSFVCQVFHSQGAAQNFTAWLSCYRIAAF